MIDECMRKQSADSAEYNNDELAQRAAPTTRKPVWDSAGKD